jgi:hypothetical protein
MEMRDKLFDACPAFRFLMISNEKTARLVTVVGKSGYNDEGDLTAAAKKPGGLKAARRIAVPLLYAPGPRTGSGRRRISLWR